MYDRSLALRYRPLKNSGARSNLPVRADLVGWWRYRTAITLTSGRATTWADQSGLDHHLTSTVGPSQMSDGSLLFNGVDQYLQAIFTLTRPFTYYVAMQQVSWTDTNILISGGADVPDLEQQTTSPRLRWANGIILATEVPVGSWAVLSFLSQTGTSTVRAYAGKPIVTASGTAAQGATGGVTLGARFGLGTFGNLAVREMAVYNVAHSNAVRLPIERYFSRIAGIGGV